jgi:hypothetical protein
MRQGLQHAMLLEETSDLRKIALQICFRADGRHAPSYSQDVHEMNVASPQSEPVQGVIGKLLDGDTYFSHR